MTQNVVTVDSVWKVLFREAAEKGANKAQLDCIKAFEQLIHDRFVGEDVLSPYAEGLLKVDTENGSLVFYLNEMLDGAMVVNGYGMKISIDKFGVATLDTPEKDVTN